MGKTVKGLTVKFEPPSRLQLIDPFIYRDRGADCLEKKIVETITEKFKLKKLLQEELREKYKEIRELENKLEEKQTG